MSADERRVRFLRDFDYRPKPNVTIAYKKGMMAFVRLECAERAIAIGAAEKVSVPKIPAGLSDTISRRRRKRPSNANTDKV
jgi:hypothetical protein